MKLAALIQYAKNLCPTDAQFYEKARFGRPCWKDQFVCFIGEGGRECYQVRVTNPGKPTETLCSFSVWVPTKDDILADDWYLVYAVRRLVCKSIMGLELMPLHVQLPQGQVLSQIVIKDYHNLKVMCETYARQWQEHEDVRLMEGTQESIKHLALKLVFGTKYDEIFK